MESNTQKKTGFQSLPKAARIALAYGISALSMVALTVFVFFLNLPHPNMILIVGLVGFTALFGYGPGIVSAADMIVYSLYYYSLDRSWFTFDGTGRVSLLVSIFGIVATLVLVGELRRRHDQLMRQMVEANDTLRANNSALMAASYTDPLVGINNRLAYRRAFPNYVGKPIYVVMLDVDDFKKVNDAYGHSAGDHILRKVGRAITGSFGADSCFRYGGDEFIVLLEDMDAEEFLDKLNSAEKFIAAPSQSHSYGRVTASAGYTYGTPSDEAELRLMVAAADHDLYQAKRQGKACHIGGAFVRSHAENIDASAHSHHYDPHA